MKLATIAVELTAARRTAGLSQRAVAGRMGTTQSAVSRVESGRAVPSLDFLERYARALGAPLLFEFGAAPELPGRRVRSERVRRVLRDYTFNPWLRNPTPAEQRTLEADGLTREYFESQATPR
jgi:transcriptional regulator with XRE-family HTH domain